MDRAFKFAEKQFNERNLDVAILIQASLLEEVVKELIALKCLLKSNFETDEEMNKYNKLFDTVLKNTFYRNIEFANKIKCFNKEIKKELHTYREERNDYIHNSFYSTIKKEDAEKLFKKGKKIIKQLVEKISNLNNKLF